MRCELCRHFHMAIKHTKNSSGLKARVCAFTWKEVVADQPSCEAFKLHHIVYCPFEAKYLQRNVKACMYRIKIKRCKCKMGLEIKKYLQSQLTGKIKRRNK